MKLYFSLILFFLSFPYNLVAECLDPDKDGFGWDGTKSCGVCIDVGNGDGWGWNRLDRVSCLLSENCIDTDGDGWGFDKVKEESCRIVTPTAGPCVDNGDGDGWGWNGIESCPLGSASTISTTTTTTTTQPQTAGAPEVGHAFNDSSSNLSSESRVNLDTVPEHLFYNHRCGETRWQEIPYRDYIIQHNIWNDSAMINLQGVDNRPRMSLCTELNGSPNNPKPKWYYDFLGQFDGLEYQVKAYPQVFYGKKYGAFNDSGTIADLGVPARINNMDNFTIEYKYSEDGIGERNVALESFFHEHCEINEHNQKFSDTEKFGQYEMMVWVGKPSIRVGGENPPVAKGVWIDGAQWDVYVNGGLDWRYIAYVKTIPSNEGILNWNKFIEYTRDVAPTLSPRVAQLRPNECMNGIEIGTEIFWGKGVFTLDRFNVVRTKYIN